MISYNDDYFELLPDPLKDRVIHEVNPPPHKPLSREILFQKNVPNWKILKDFYTLEGRLSKQDIMTIINSFTKLVQKEPNLIKLMDPVVIVGDIHGQFYDLLKIFDASGGSIEENRYIFLGDYVDRGNFSLEVCILLFALKINFPTQYYLLRGNHESRQMTTFFNFHTECLIKYDEEVYLRIMEAFDALPISAIVNDRFFLVHGGISPETSTLDVIININRYVEIPKSGVLCDLVWSDPIDEEMFAINSDWEINTSRGCSFNFGAKSLIPFLAESNLISVIRAHEVQMEGFKFYKWNKKVDFPSCITLFSAANYCDVYNNKGAIIKIKSSQFNLVQINCNPHPFYLPEFQNIFSWSLPFISEKSK